MAAEDIAAYGAVRVVARLESRVRSSARRARIVGVVALAIVAGLATCALLLPGFIARRIEHLLAAHGCPGARIGVARLGLGRLVLHDVALGNGLAIGAVELDAGLSLLWRARVHQVTLRDANLDLEAVARWMPGRAGAGAAGGELPVDVVRIDRGVVTLGATRAHVSGTISGAQTISVELSAANERIRIGGTELRELRATIRDAGPGLRACATGRVSQAAVEACTDLPRSHAALHALRALTVTLQADAPGWQLRGRGTLAWDGPLRLADGHLDLRAASLTAGGATVEGLEITAQLDGDLGRRRLELHGDARAARGALHGRAVSAPARRLHAPFAASLDLVDGAVRLVPRRAFVVAAHDTSIRIADTAVEFARTSLELYDAGRPVVLDAALAAPRALRWSAGEARLGEARFVAPSGTLARRTLRWRAASAAWRGTRIRTPAGSIGFDAARGVTATWAGMTGPGPLELGAGELRGHLAGHRWTLVHARARALGGELAIDPFASPAHRPVELVVRARGLDLHRVLAAFARGRADGSGLLDGELAIRIGAGGASVTRAALAARAIGSLQLSDAAWRARASASAVGFALHQRITAALSDFRYSRLAAVLHPAGVDPELQISAQGRGKRVAQALDVVINLRGVRDVARRLPFAQPLRSNP